MTDRDRVPPFRRAHAQSRHICQATSYIPMGVALILRTLIMKDASRRSVNAVPAGLADRVSATRRRPVKRLRYANIHTDITPVLAIG